MMLLEMTWSRVVKREERLRCVSALLAGYASRLQCHVEGDAALVSAPSALADTTSSGSRDPSQYIITLIIREVCIEYMKVNFPHYDRSQYASAAAAKSRRAPENTKYLRIVEVAMDSTLEYPKWLAFQ